jgi:hypothetical protein
MANNIHILWLRILLYPSISSIHQQFILWASVSFNFSPSGGGPKEGSESNRPVGLACQPPGNGIFLSEQTSHQQPVLSEQTTTSQTNRLVIFFGYVLVRTIASGLLR